MSFLFGTETEGGFERGGSEYSPGDCRANPDRARRRERIPLMCYPSQSPFFVAQEERILTSFRVVRNTNGVRMQVESRCQLASIKLDAALFARKKPPSSKSNKKQ